MGVYTLVYTDPLNPRRKIVGYAPGLAGLRSYFEDLRLHVDWERGRSPLDAPLPLHRRRPRTRGQLRRQRRRAEHNLQRARRAKRAVRAERSEDGAG